MANDYFKFKQFTVHQGGSAMKVGTDGVLLGAWAGLKLDCAVRVLDIGTGTGLVALMLAQRFAQRFAAVQVEAVEIDSLSACQAAENFADSPWADRLSVTEAAVQDFAQHSPYKYDLVVSNPPYFNRSLTCSDTARTLARHTDQLPWSELAQCTNRLLAPQGCAAFIIPTDQSADFVSEFAMVGLRPCRQTLVHPNNSKPAKRVLIEFFRDTTSDTDFEEACDTGFEEARDIVDTAPTLQTSNLTIETDQRHIYSEEYRALTQDFYLFF